MKLLPQKQLADKINDQKKSEIDAGLFLARKVDALRENLADTQKEHDESIDSLNKEFALFSGEMASKKYELEREIKGLETVRLSLQKPLDDAWEVFHRQNDELLVSQNKLLEDKNKVNERKIELDKISERIDKLLEEITCDKSESEQKLLKVDILLKETKEELKIAKKERLEQHNKHEKKIRELSNKQTEYEIALNTLEIKKQELDTKESELINREKHLESQQVSLRIAYEKIKQNGNSSTTNDSR
jgi:hypothetical protein